MCLDALLLSDLKAVVQSLANDDALGGYEDFKVARKQGDGVERSCSV
jgi:hypothetical protein